MDHLPYGTIVDDGHSGWRYMVLGRADTPPGYTVNVRRWYSMLILARPAYEHGDDRITIVSAEWIGNNVVEKAP